MIQVEQRKVNRINKDMQNLLSRLTFLLSFARLCWQKFTRNVGHCKKSEIRIR